MIPLTLCTPERVTRLLKTVAGYYHLTPAELTGNRRMCHLIRPRHVAMYLLRTRTNYSLQNIGYFLGNRDHTTVLNGVRNVGAAIADDVGELAQQVRALVWDLDIQEAQEGQRSA